MPPGQVVPLSEAVARLAGRIPGSPLDEETAGMLLRGNAAPEAEVMKAWAGLGYNRRAVALHRAAYLLYEDPRLGSGRGGVLFVGPHQPYLNYVADVLPSLGEEGVRTCTLADLVPEGATAVPEPDPSLIVEDPDLYAHQLRAHRHYLAQSHQAQQAAAQARAVADQARRESIERQQAETRAILQEKFPEYLSDEHGPKLREELGAVAIELGFTPQELEQFGETFTGDWSGSRRSSADPATDFSLTYGNNVGGDCAGVNQIGYENLVEDNSCGFSGGTDPLLGPLAGCGGGGDDRDADGVERVIATSQMQATDCRRAFPCWDEPDLKATFTFTVTASDGALSSAAATVTLTLAAVNDAPSLAAINVNGTEDTTFTFAAAVLAASLVVVAVTTATPAWANTSTGQRRPGSPG